MKVVVILNFSLLVPIWAGLLMMLSTVFIFLFFVFFYFYHLFLQNCVSLQNLLSVLQSLFSVLLTFLFMSWSDFSLKSLITFTSRLEFFVWHFNHFSVLWFGNWVVGSLYFGLQYVPWHMHAVKQWKIVMNTREKEREEQQICKKFTRNV